MNRVILASFTCLAFISACAKPHSAKEDLESHRQKMKHGILKMYKSTEEPGALDISLNPDSVARGKLIYEEHCLNCHGVQGHGDGPLAKPLKIQPPDLAEIARKIPDLKFFMKISKWNGEMPGWNTSFSQKQTTDIESYLKNLGQQDNVFRGEDP